MTDPKPDDKGPSEEQKGALKSLLSEVVNSVLDEREVKAAAAREEQEKEKPEEKRTSTGGTFWNTLFGG